MQNLEELGPHDTQITILIFSNPHIPLDPTRHCFRPLHATNTLLVDLTQKNFNGINSAKSLKCTLLVALDVTKAFDTILRSCSNRIPKHHTRKFTNGVPKAQYYPLFSSIYTCATSPTQITHITT